MAELIEDPEYVKYLASNSTHLFFFHSSKMVHCLTYMYSDYFMGVTGLVSSSR
jgi:hypothetical protein